MTPKQRKKLARHKEIEKAHNLYRYNSYSGKKKGRKKHNVGFMGLPVVPVTNGLFGGWVV